MRDDLAMLRRCDGIVLCGGRLSKGMALELEAAREAGLWVISLLNIGAQPPARHLGVMPLVEGAKSPLTPRPPGEPPPKEEP